MTDADPANVIDVEPLSTCCEEQTLRDCFGELRCVACDGPCPGCYSGLGPDEFVCDVCGDVTGGDVFTDPTRDELQRCEACYLDARDGGEG